MKRFQKKRGSALKYSDFLFVAGSASSAAYLCSESVRSASYEKYRPDPAPFEFNACVKSATYLR